MQFQHLLTSFSQAYTVLGSVEDVKEWTKHPLSQGSLMRENGYKLQFAKAKAICSRTYTDAKYIYIINSFKCHAQFCWNQIPWLFFVSWYLLGHLSVEKWKLNKQEVDYFPSFHKMFLFICVNKIPTFIHFFNYNNSENIVIKTFYNDVFWNRCPLWK